MVFFLFGLLVAAPLSTISFRALKVRASFADFCDASQQFSILNSLDVHCFEYVPVRTLPMSSEAEQILTILIRSKPSRTISVGDSLEGNRAW